MLRANPDVVATVEGCPANSDFQQSERRAQSIASALIGRGVSANQIAQNDKGTSLPARQDCSLAILLTRPANGAH
jgi:outer membrane protein OmpA-like peptidoglycan-associated protein